MVAIGMTGYYRINRARVIKIPFDVLNNLVSSNLKSSINNVNSLNTTNGIPKWYSISDLARFYVKVINLKKSDICYSCSFF